MIKAAIIGASGYTGKELLRLISSREDVMVTKVIANSNAGKFVSDLIHDVNFGENLMFEKYSAGILNSLDVAFISLPSGEAMKIVPDILRAGARVIDLGGDYRLKNTEHYEEYYGNKHLSADLVQHSVYGLPEINSSEIKSAQLVANPGCYATSILLSLLPALKEDVAKPKGIVVSSVSGVSGAGRKESHEFSFTEVNENVRAYKLTNHQHIPEIRQVLNSYTNSNVSLTFIPHLVPLTRGIYTTIVADMKAETDDDCIYGIYRDFYSQSPFVRIRENIPQILEVARTNFCDIHLRIKNNKLIITSSIDNLVKGAAGQALQNMNIMFGFPETKGFLRKENLNVQ